MDKAQQPVAMEQNIENYDFSLDTNVKILKKTTDNIMLSKKCNQCKGRPHKEKHVFFRALPEKGGGGVYPCPNFLALFSPS